MKKGLEIMPKVSARGSTNDNYSECEVSQPPPLLLHPRQENSGNYEKQCFLRMVQMMEDGNRNFLFKHENEDRKGHLLEKVVTLKKRAPVTNRPSDPVIKKHRCTWHLYDDHQPKRSPEKSENRKKAKNRSCSADSSKKSVRISCDVSNLSSGSGNSPTKSGGLRGSKRPNLEVIGTKSHFNQINGSNGGASNRPVIKGPNLRGSKSSQDKMHRSRQILKELQRQVGNLHLN